MSSSPTPQTTTLVQFLKSYDKIIIPGMQRDYVLGAGDTECTNLLNALQTSFQKKIPFPFSCLMGHVHVTPEGNKHFLVYDGQQRLVTLIYSLAFLGHSTPEQKVLLSKFTFETRPSANQLLQQLLYPTPDHPTLPTVDCTQFALYRLNATLTSQPLPFSSYLWDSVLFECVVIQQVGDAEQFFMDLNDGVALDAAEIFKARCHYFLSQNPHVQKAQQEGNDVLEAFFLTLENQWLTCFYEQYATNCERYLMNTLLYFLTMMGLSQGEHWTEEQCLSLTLPQLNQLSILFQRICTSLKNTSPLYFPFVGSDTPKKILTGLSEKDSTNATSSLVLWYYLTLPNATMWDMVTPAQQEAFDEFLRFVSKFQVEQATFYKTTPVSCHTHAQYYQIPSVTLPTGKNNTSAWCETLLILYQQIPKNTDHNWFPDFFLTVGKQGASYGKNFPTFFKTECLKQQHLWRNFPEEQRKFFHNNWCPDTSWDTPPHTSYEDIKALENLPFLKSYVTPFLDKTGELLWRCSDFSAQTMDFNTETSEIARFVQAGVTSNADVLASYNPLLPDITLTWFFGRTPLTKSNIQRLPTRLFDFFFHPNHRYTIPHLCQALKSPFPSKPTCTPLGQCYLTFATCPNAHLALLHDQCIFSPWKETVVKRITREQYYDLKLGTINTSFTENHSSYWTIEDFIAFIQL